MNQIQANIRVLSDDESVRIHNTSMRILSEIGLHVPNETVCSMAQKLGAKVDGETVRIPAEALDPILALARAGDHAFAASGQTVRKISGNESTQIFVFDEQTGTRRQGTMQDVRDGIATAQMAAFYGLTSGSNSGLTDALYPDFQVGFEKSFSAVCSVRRSARRPSSRKTAPMSRSSTAHSAQCWTRSCRMHSIIWTHNHFQGKNRTKNKTHRTSFRWAFCVIPFRMRRYRADSRHPFGQSVRCGCRAR